MMGFDVTVAELPAAQAEIRAITAELRAGRMQLATTVADLVSGG